MSERQGVEVDYCPQCRGIWLDRGELDKILDRVQPEGEVAMPAAPPAAPVANEPPRYSEPRYDDRRRDERYDERRRDGHYDDRRRDSRSGYRKKKSPFEFLGDIFEG